MLEWIVIFSPAQQRRQATLKAERPLLLGFLDLCIIG